MKLVAILTTALAALIPTAASAGFVTTAGSAFENDGRPFHVFGTNAYWSSETQWSVDQLDVIFGSMAADGLTACRVWGFNDATSASGVYFQLWQNGVPSINVGSDGLAYFDLVVTAAKTHGVKLVVPFVNNWPDYGGMDVYVQQLGGHYHDEFYTLPAAKDAYKHYVKAFVTCYKYIKNLDPNHLVSAGDEGWFNNDPSNYPYSGYDGVDFEKNLQIASLDYGRYHAYPDHWGIPLDTAKAWGLKWIEDHLAAGAKAGKPVILEEFGARSKDVSLYQAWSAAVYAGRSGMQYWQYGLRSLGTHDDTFTVYNTDPLFNSTIKPMATLFKALKQ